jgi:hypothetical protein
MHMLRMLARTSWLGLIAVLVAAPASAQVVQALHIGGGAFLPRGYDARVQGDVLNEDLNSLVFKIKDFTSGQMFGEWLVAFGDHVEIGAGAGYYRGGTPSLYRDYTHPDQTEIEQELRLRVIPVTGVVRLLAFRPTQVQPYVGAGVAALNYRYSEFGEFVEFPSLDTFRTRYTATGTAVGPVFLAGIRVPIKGDIWGFTTEWRYQGGSGKTGGTANGFLDDKIDLSGSNVNFGFLVRF